MDVNNLMELSKALRGLGDHLSQIEGENDEQTKEIQDAAKQLDAKFNELNQIAKSGSKLIVDFLNNQK